MSVLTVSQLNCYVNFLLKEDVHLQTVFLRGEIANFQANKQSGHFYFSLRDESASVRAVMFHTAAQRLPYSPQNGMAVLVQGSVSLYEATGTYQVIVTDMQPDGYGSQALALKQRREELEKRGFFDAERKRKLPPFPKKIGIVTSQNAAALQDMLNVIGRRYPIGEVLIFHTSVQGTDAPLSIAQALRTAATAGCDVILMGRGGGSNEDLSAFQEEVVAEAVFASPVPVISAVGHATDHCIADEVADIYAPTPSAAAELAVPDCSELLGQCEALRLRLEHAIAAQTESAEQSLRLLVEKLLSLSPNRQITSREESLAVLANRLHSAALSAVDRKQQQWELTAQRLENMSPIAILKRGYALAYRGETLVRDAKELKVGDRIRIRFASGSVEAEIKG